MSESNELDEIEDLLKNGKKEEAFELIKEKDNKDKNSLAEGLIERGSSLVENKEYDLAIIYFEFLEKIAIDNEIKEIARKHLTDIYLYRGVAYYDLNKYNKAIAEHNEAIKLDPTLAVAYNCRGTAYYNLNRYKEAIKLDPTLAVAYANRGVVYSELERYKEAIADCNEAIKLYPTYPTLAVAYNNRGLTYYDLMMYNEAIEDYYKAIELKPDFDIAHANLGNSLYMTEDYDNAEKEYREAVMNENIGYAHNGLGLVLNKREAYKNAITEFKKALELNKDADFYNNLGCAYAEYGKGSVIAPFILLCAHHKLTKATQEKNTHIKAYKNLTHVGDLLKDEGKILLLRIFIISFVFALSLFALSINLFELSKDNWLGIILILTGVATLGIVLFSSDFTKIEIKSLKIAGVEAKFNYEKPKAGEKVLQFAKPK